MQFVVGRDRLRHFVDQTNLQVILQVLADTCAIGDDRNPVPVQERGRPDARHLQQLRRLQRAGRENHLAQRAHLVHLAMLDVPHAGRLRAVEQHLQRLRIGFDMQVRPPARFRYATAVEQRSPLRVVSW